MNEKITTLRAAILYRKAGLSVIPILQNDKKPAVKWEKYQKEIASEDDLVEWFSSGRCNLGIVTGKISNILVVDCDTAEALERVWAEGAGESGCPIQFTPRGGRHYFFKYEDGFISRRYSDGIDIKTDGGYVVAWPSTIGDKGWSWGNGRSIFKTMPPNLGESLKRFIVSLPGASAGYNKGANGDKNTTIIQTMFHGGQLDEDLFTVSNSLVKGGASPEVVQKTLEVLAEYGNQHRNGRPSYTTQEVSAKVKSALARVGRRDRNLHQDVRDWVSLMEGTFSSKDMMKELGLTEKIDMQNAWACLKKMCTEGSIEHKAGADSHTYRIRETEFEKMDFFSATGSVMDIKWPLGIESLYRSYPGSVVVLAGVSGSGKTTFGLNFALKNTQVSEPMTKHNITYMSSELGTLELKDRLGLFGFPLDVWSPINFIKVGSSFDDAIDPDGINVIDYLEVFDEFWRTGLLIKNINDRLKKGMALILMQRPSNRPTASGGEHTLAKPRLYLSMDQPYGEYHRMIILKAHNWKDSQVNPKNKAIQFKIIRGSKIEAMSRWTEQDPNSRGFKDMEGNRV